MKGFSRLTASAFSTMSLGLLPTMATQMRGKRSGRCRGRVGRGVDMLLSAWSLQGACHQAQAQSGRILPPNSPNLADAGHASATHLNVPAKLRFSPVSL